MSIDPAPLLLTVKLAAVTTAILLVIGIPLATWIARSRAGWKPLIETLVSMPLVLPPSVLGFYLLLAFSPQSAFGHWLDQAFDLRLVFTFAGLVVGSVIFSLPFMVQPIQVALTSLPPSLREASLTLGKSPLATFFRVELPNIKPALIAGTVMSFAHTVGEFGLVLMIGGNIPGVTQVASIAIYNEVELLNYPAAHVYAAILCSFAFGVVLLVNLLQHRWRGMA